MLCLAASHHPDPTLARYEKTFIEAFSVSLGHLTHSSGEHESTSFEDVLAIILAGLSSLGWISGIGYWASLGYRLWLDGIAEETEERLTHWRGLWEGLRVSCQFFCPLTSQTLELEHCSLHLSQPILPRHPPHAMFAEARDGLRALRSGRTDRPASPVPDSASTALGDLYQIMQEQLPHLVGKGYQTLWSKMNPRTVEDLPNHLDGIQRCTEWTELIDKWFSRSVRQSEWSL